MEKRCNQIISNGQRQVSIHVSLIYRHGILEVDGVSSTPEEINIICEHFYIISPDEKHNQYFVHYVQKSISEYLNSINYYVTVRYEFCDGCQCQYKSRNCFWNFAESVEEFEYSQNHQKVVMIKAHRMQLGDY